ncbi:uncharacterized protein [Haliotis cracherodii]|uniref:uncharacterized protein n=1 Tax=Haliotis cracherodii TaxID=6455 RepID=UPI0039EC034E
MVSRDCPDSAISITYRCINISWRKVATIFAAFLLMFWFSFSVFTEMKFHNKKWYQFSAPCKTDTGVMNDMKELVFKIHETLNTLSVPHAVCYGTLWGTLRNQQILPWDNNVDFCVNALDIMKLDRRKMADLFRRNGMIMSYNSKQGVYEIKYKSAEGLITTFLANIDGEMYRTGWFHNIMWLFEKKSINFPLQLLEAPFPTAKLYGKDVPVPHENIEILKYLYPSDWWLEVKPPGC